MAFRDHTTFIIGAGASAEFGLPVGSGLASLIRTSADISVDSGDYMRRFVEEHFRTVQERGEAFKALQDIHEGIHTAVSIDAFIHRHHKSKLIERLGKALISQEIFRAEERSTMSVNHWRKFILDPNHVIEDGDRRYLNPDYTWLGHFFRILTDNVTDPSDVGKNITIVCFNYDRCIEHYLVQNLGAAYRIDHSAALAIVEKNIKIIHPYGYLGKITDKVGLYSDGRVSYGYELGKISDLEEVSQNIRTYTEQSHDVDQIHDIHEAITDCKNLVFLGFGFNNQNLDLLRVKDVFTGNAHPKNIYSTGFGLYHQIGETLTRRILDLFIDDKDHAPWRSRVRIEFGVGCSELLRIHDMNLNSFIQRVVKIDDSSGRPKSKVERYTMRIS